MPYRLEEVKPLAELTSRTVMNVQLGCGFMETDCHKPINVEFCTAFASGQPLNEQVNPWVHLKCKDNKYF